MIIKTNKSLIAMTIIGTLALSACSQPAQEENVVASEEQSVSQAAAAPEAPKTPVSEKLAPYLERDIKDDIFYFVMPDRFHNANPENDMGDPERPISYGGLDKTSKWAFHGGDMQGLEAKLDYLQDMGISAIWMTPILRNKAIQPDGFAHHGYWVVDFTEIDPHFGSNEDLKSLINAAHDRNIKVFFDIITNHTADVIKYRECHNEKGEFLNPEQRGCAFKTKAEIESGNKYTPFVPDHEKGVKVPEWLNDPAIYNNQGDSTWEGESVITGDFVGLDDINTSLPEVQQNMIDVFQDLISEFKPDGFRIDTVKHVDIEFWQVFGPAIVEHAKSIGIPQFHIFGEVYDGNPAVLSDFTTTGKLPSVLDFSFHFNVKDALFSGMDVNRLAHLFDNDDYYRDNDSSPLDLMNFLGNHDAGRVGFFINQGFADVDAQEKLDRSLLAHAFMYFSRGIPVVYYGDEQGFTGDGGDVDAREDMDPSLVDVYNDNILLGTTKTTADDNFDQAHPIYQKLAKLADIRAENNTLARGEQYNRLLDNDKRLYAFSRVDTSNMQEYIAVFNMSTQEQQVSLIGDAGIYATIAGEAMTQSGKELSVSLPPLSYSLMKSNRALPYADIADISIETSFNENRRTFIPFEISFISELALNLAEVRIYDVSVEGEEKLLAVDPTSPHRLVLTEERAQILSKLKVVASNYNGQTVEKVFEL